MRRVLVVHRAERASTLADALADVLAHPLDDPFATELVAVPARGVERWLAQRLSHRLGVSALVPTRGTTTPADGVCANVAFPSPRAMLDDAVATVAPDVAARLADWAPERLTWSVLDALDASLEEDWCRVPRRYLLGGSGSPDHTSAPTGRRLSLAAHVARLFDAYARSRPQMLERWAEGDLSLADGTPLEAHEQWQPRLWHLILDHLGASPVGLQKDALEAIRAHPERLTAPDRLSVFGASRLTRADVQVLAAIAEHRDVHLWLHHASPALWDAVAARGPATRRIDDATPLVNPLLRSLSRDVRELQHVLRACAPSRASVRHAPPGAGRPAPSPGRRAAPAPATLLDRLRGDLAADCISSALPLDPTDRSLQVHACHGRTRQVEVLRDVVVGLLADDPTLEPRDILVMCPDVEAFAPLLAATFTGAAADGATTGGAPTADTHPAARLRVRVADRALHQSNPLISALDRLLDLGTARCTAGQVLDLAEHPAVARRFGFDDDAIERIRGWVDTAGIRWGLDQAHRSTWHLDRIPDGTWRLGLDRVLVGAAVECGPGGAARTIAGLLPLDDVDSADLDLAGRFAEFLDRLDAALHDVAGPRPAAAWAPLLEQATMRLAAPPPGETWQEVQVREVLDDALADHAPDGGGPPLTLAELRPALRAALAGRPTRAGFRTGALTVCTLVPMRSVPHRVIVLLGLDDGAFPRRCVRDGDDLLTRDPWVGDHDPRSEDRQLLLDAVCAAEEHLVITYTGHDERTGAPVPPAVPLGEVLDAVDRAVVVVATTGPGAPHRGRDAIITHHPLQPFDARVFAPGAGVPGSAGSAGAARPFGFDPLAFRGALAAQAQRSDPPPLLRGPLPAPDVADVALEDVIALLTHPAKAFLRQRLLVSLTERDEDPDDSLPLELDHLESWGVGDRLLRDRLAGLDAPAARRLERARGTLPPGPIGDCVLDGVAGQVEGLATAAAPLLAEDSVAWEVAVDLGDGTRLTGTVGGVRGTSLVRVEYSRLAPKHRLTAWLRLLALTAAHPDTDWRAVTLGRGPSGKSAPPRAQSTLGPVPTTTALALVRQYVALYRDGLCAPLPVPCKTAEAYADLRAAGRRISSARTGAASAWVDGKTFPGEQSDAAHVLIHDGAAPFAVLLAEPARTGDYHNNWPADEEGDRFGVLARRLWDPLLRHEKRGTP